MFGLFIKGGSIYNALLSILTGAIVSLSIAGEGNSIIICWVLYFLCLITQYFISPTCRIYDHCRTITLENWENDEKAVSDTLEMKFGDDDVKQKKGKFFIVACSLLFFVSTLFFCFETASCVRTIKKKDLERTARITNQLDSIQLNSVRLNGILEQESSAARTLLDSFNSIEAQQQDIAKEITQLSIQLHQINQRINSNRD